MPRKSSTYLTHYASPADASPRERAVARLALQLLLNLGRTGRLSEIQDDFLAASGRLLAWSRPMLLRLSRLHHKSRTSQVRTFHARTSTRRESLSRLVIGYDDDDVPLSAAALIDPNQ